MNLRSVATRLPQVVAAAGLAVGLPQFGLAQDSTPMGTASIAVFADRYASSGQAFVDLDALEAAVQSMHPRVVQLHACGSAANRPLLAAAYRLRHRYVEMRVSSNDEPACTVATTVRAMTISVRPSRPADDVAAVDGYWRGLMP